MRDAAFIKKNHFCIYDGIVPVFRVLIILVVSFSTFIKDGMNIGLDNARICVLVYLAYSLALIIFPRLRKYIAYNYPLVFPNMDMVLFSCCIVFTGGANSFLYLFYIFFIIFFSIVYGFKKSLIASTICVVYYIAAVMIADGYVSFEVYIRLVFFMAISFFTGYIFEKANEQTYTMATQDSLTSLYNHQYFYRSLEHVIAKSSKGRSPVSLAIFDIDNFKCVNDKYGHLEGDRILKEISSIVKKNVRSEDIAARYGGDEIVILLPNVDREAAFAVCQRIKDIFQQSYRTQEGEEITLSVGIATFPVNAANSIQLFHAADKALYRAKNSGKNTVEYCTV